MKDQRYYDAVAQEQRENKLDEGLWLKAMAASNNDREQARAAYVALRVEQLKEMHMELLSVAHAANKRFCTCPQCDCAGPFPTRWIKKICLLLSLLPFSGFYWQYEELAQVANVLLKHKMQVLPDELPNALLLVLAFITPFFVVLIAMRGSVRCPSCGFNFLYNKKAPQGNTLIGSS